ncbi:NUDIX domain-containing protein [Streptomyces sp. NPDC091267]|uniref:NUDIX hydrolase n=1 Tax=unclassified Streptomyces TaxID=2593676 RepID=UPI00341CB29E
MTELPPEPPVLGHRGNVLAAFRHGVEGEPPGDAPVPMSLTALWHHGKVLLVFDRYRNSWELPGGTIEPGETPREAALRELLEESGQQPDDPVAFVSYAAFLLGPDRRAEYGALFTGRTTAPRTFRPDEEIAAVRWWDPATPLPERTEPIDAWLARLTRDPAQG